MAAYRKVNSRQWVRPRRRGYKAMCCDCGLVHVLEFRLVREGRRGQRIEFRAARDNRATGQARRKRK